jgi:uncharacterized lipoprotein YmbA
MSRCGTQTILILLAAGAAFGCGTSAPARFYSLNSTAIPSGPPMASTAVMVGSVSVPAVVDQPQFVVELSSNRVEVDEFNRWAAPLNDSIAHAVAGDLAVLLGTPEVAAAPFANFEPTYTVTIEVQRFASIPGEAAIVEAVWTVHKTADGKTRSGRSVAREAVQGDSRDALAAAHSRALASISGDIATAVRTEAGDEP